MNSISPKTLGKLTDYPEEYSPEILEGIPRSISREELQIKCSKKKQLPFYGTDFWTAYEISWLSPSAKPINAIGRFAIDCNTVNIVESKSVKLYLNSLNFKTIQNIDAASQLIKDDLEKVVKGEVKLELFSCDSSEAKDTFSINQPNGICLDNLEVQQTLQSLSNPAGILMLDKKTGVVTQESLYSNLFRSTCPVTGQPDWATVEIIYSGEKINHNSLLSYLLSYRRHSAFHESCVEKIFTDISKTCNPSQLSVSAGFTRRGGVEINPFRSSFQPQLGFANRRLIRQ